MSESPMHSSSESFSGMTKVLPRPITDPTILDSVASYINEVVPTSHSGVQENTDPIIWARFDEVDIENVPESENSTLILILGYNTGVQVWAIPANGEATEILAWRHSFVKFLKFLPVPYLVDNVSKKDLYDTKRPLVAVCDSASSVHTGPLYSTLSFLSLKTGEQVKMIKFKNTVLDVLANKQSVVVCFQEKIALFDAFTLEDHMTVTTCYLSPGLNPNPVTLGARWLAYAEKKMSPHKRSSGGMETEGVQSYTATVLHAAKTLGRGLRELGESVASSLTGGSKPGTSPNSPQAGGQADVPHKGVVTILDIGNPIHAQERPPVTGDPIIAHFNAHTDAIVALKFDPSGMLLLTADKRGHDFHLFRIQPHPCGSTLATVHHLYILHRGDTTARVQDIAFAPDSRWVAVSTGRGTTHVFPITPYGGNVGVRTHTSHRVVNKMSRFHRSAGLTDGRSNSPSSTSELSNASTFPYQNPRLPPFPRPNITNALAQIKSPFLLPNAVNSQQTRHKSARERLSSCSDEHIVRIVSCFAAPRALLDVSRDSAMNWQQRACESLFVMSYHGSLLQYDLQPHQHSSIPKERSSHDSPIELIVTAKAQWLLQRRPGSADIQPPISKENMAYLLGDNEASPQTEAPMAYGNYWLSQVEIMTHVGPHRRLWMGPQFIFKTYTIDPGSPLSQEDVQPLDVGSSKPINMPIAKSNAILIESGSASSSELSLPENYPKGLEEGSGSGEMRLREDLADAMQEYSGIRETGGRCVIVQMKPAVAKVVNPLGTVVNVHSDEEVDIEVFEEAIHENCDESLFRPVVASKIVNKDKVPYGNNMLTKSLEATTEVAVKILKKPTNKVADKCSVKPTTDTNHKNEPKKNKNKVVTNVKVEPIFDLLDSKPLIKVSSEPKFNSGSSHLQKNDAHQEVKSILDFPPLDNDNFSLENLVKDTFEDVAEEPSHNEVKKFKPKNDKHNLENLSEVNSSEESVVEEKVASRRNRKPKPKLGVKIVNVNNENTDKSITEITLPAPQKKSWSTIAASKPKQKPLIDYTEPDLYCVTDVYPKKISSVSSNISDFIDITDPEDEKIDLNTDRDPFSVQDPDESGLFKIHKCSDDEKCDLSSSPAEATESDDSGKISSTTVLQEIKATSNNKNCKKKKKKK